MKTIDHWIGGASAAGASTRTAPVYDPAPRGKVVTSRWPEASHARFHFPTAK